MRSLIRKVRFFFERAFLEGSWAQLLLVALAITIVSLVGGSIAHFLTDQFASLDKAVWWSFLRLTDPGYLGDDEGAILRTISTILTVTGYVLFMGTLVALMTQWMWRSVRTLEEGRTPLSLRGHIVIAGLDQRTPELIREMLLSDERLNLFLRKLRRSKLSVVVLTSRPGIEAVQMLKAELAQLWTDGQVIVRYGRASDPDDLERVDLANAAVVLVPQVNGGQGDARTSTILAAINHTVLKWEQPSPLIVCEFNQLESKGVLGAFPRLTCEAVFSRATITKILAQSLKHAGLARVFMELLSHRDGHEIYIKDFPEIIGKSWSEVEDGFEHALPIGLLRRTRQGHELVLDPHAIIDKDDRPLFMSEEVNRIIYRPGQTKREKSELLIYNQPEILIRSVLIIGPTLAANELMQELQEYRDFKPSVDIVSSLEEVDLTKYDKVILLPFFKENLRPDEVDQHTIHSYFMLRSLLNDQDHHLDILVELASPTAAEAFALEARCDVIVPALISSHLLAHIGLRRELGAVFEEVLGTTGADMTMLNPQVYGIGLEQDIPFQELRRIVRSHGHVLLGLRIAVDEDKHRRKVILAPRTSQVFNLNKNDRLIVLN